MPREKTMDDAPPHYNADSASGWAAGYNAALGELSEAAADVVAERQRQTKAEGWTPEHDDSHVNGELAKAAACYAHVAAMRDTNRAIEIDNAARGTHADAIVIARSWPWQWSWWKPKDRRRDLVRAAALIIAEIERLDRAASKLQS